MERAARSVRVQATGQIGRGLLATLETSRSITVPPSSAASRTPGGKAGRRPSRSRRAMAGRACAVCPPNQRAAPSISHAQRSSARSRRGVSRLGRSRLFSTITRRA